MEQHVDDGAERDRPAADREAEQAGEHEQQRPAPRGRAPSRGAAAGAAPGSGRPAAVAVEVMVVLRRWSTAGKAYLSDVVGRGQPGGAGHAAVAGPSPVASARDDLPVARAGAGRAPAVGGYTLLTKLGEGGMGVVHLARRGDGDRVALKVLRPHIVGDDEARQRLAREVGSLSRIRSRWVAEIVDADPWARDPVRRHPLRPRALAARPDRGGGSDHRRRPLLVRRRAWPRGSPPSTRSACCTAT